MSYTKGLVLSDLRDCGSMPSHSNNSYEFDVFCWCFSTLLELGTWNGKANCHCLDEWVSDFSFKFKEYAKQHWKNSYKSFKSAHKVWLAATVDFPERQECLCGEDVENLEVSLYKYFHYFLKVSLLLQKICCDGYLQISLSKMLFSI